MNRIFRDESGFKGFNTSDWGGTHGTLYIKEGLDLEMPGGTFFAAVPGQGRSAGVPGGNAAGAAAANAATGRGGQDTAAVVCQNSIQQYWDGFLPD